VPLPPGPSAPAPLQTARLLARPIPFFESCRRRYGETFTARVLRAGALVFISDPPSLKRLFGADRVNTIAPGRNVILQPIMGSRSVLLLEDEEHLRRRKLMLPPFHGERMRAYESVIEEATEREVAAWPADRRFPLHPRMQAITLEVIMRAVFGIEDDERRARLRPLLVEILSGTQSPAAIGMTIPGVRRLGRFRRVVRLIAQTDDLLAAQIAERRAAPDLEGRQDILSLLVSARFDDGSAMDDREVRDQLMTLLLAGHETTATALAWAFDLLLHDSGAYERAREEVAAGRSDYLDAVGEEAMRMRPVIPFTGRELREPAELGGYELDAGTVVMAAIYLAHTRPDLFPDPREFRPERFLDGGPETFSWIPFGGGTRRCLGAAFAQFEMRVVLRTVLARSVLRAADDRMEAPVRRNVTLSPKGGTGALLVERL
jgi:cytochrome P450 family 135